MKMEDSVQTQTTRLVVDHQDAWQMVLSQLRSEMSRAMFETWVEPLRVLGYRSQVFQLGASNPYARDWVESHLKNRITHLLKGLYNQPLTVEIAISNGFYPAQPLEAGQEAATVPTGTQAPASAEVGAEVPLPLPTEPGQAEPSRRKTMLQRAYGSQRASVIQPERGMFLTLYFFNNWLPLLGHSGATVILAARSMCYWNPLTGELRNIVETDMSEIARRASVSVRTVKEVLGGELVQNYFLRYKVRRMMTPNGVRTAGIVLQVRMDDPLTPEDQAAYSLPEENHWYTGEFEDEEE
jgi:hypothetical protein